MMKAKLWCWLALAGLLLQAQAYARGGGGCLAEGTRILTPQGPVAIERLKPGDHVVALAGGKQVSAMVQGIVVVEPAEYVELALPGRTLRLTAEHPVQVGPGVFRAAGALQTGDQIDLLESVVRIEFAKRLPASVPAYNLLVMPGGTFIAEGVVVHNKGCFLPDTSILRADGSSVPISEVRVGERLRAFTTGGELVDATVRQIFSVAASDYYVVTTERAVLRVTAEHPFYIGSGTFKTVAALKPGDIVFAADAAGLRKQRIVAMEKVAAPVTVYNLRTDAPNTYFAAGIAVHNKGGGGGCFQAGTPIATPDGLRPIEELKPGDPVWSMVAGRQQTATVQACYQVEPESYCALTVAGRSIRVTEEHPLLVADGGFREAGSLKVGDPVAVMAEGQQYATFAPIESAVRVRAELAAYNLLVMPGGTFIANGIVGHNKGCFLPDTPILRTDGSSVMISEVRVGERLRAFTTGGESVDTTVRELYSVQANEYFILRAGEVTLRVTAEHPFYVGRRTFKTVAALRPGDTLYAADASGLRPRTINSIRRMAGPVQVFNLRTDAPNTYFAAGIAVHNKGFSGGSRGGSSGGGGKPWSQMSSLERTMMVAFMSFFGLIFLVIIWAAMKGKIQSSKTENLDFLFDRKRIEAKSGKTMKLLEFIAKVDGTMAPDKLKVIAKGTFLKLQTCWQARSYDPMKPLLMPDLYKDHLRQINGMIRNHEINKMDGVMVETIDLVNVRYTHKPNNREFTVLFTASMKDYYVDDRSGSFLRGDSSKARFQEFWTFQFLDGQWLLREVEQTGESDILKDENFFEQFTDQGVKEVYAETAAQQGAEGPWLEKPVDAKADRTERLLNFLAQTDKLWTREAMLQRARQVFLNLRLAEEKGDPDAIPSGELFPEMAASMKAALQARQAKLSTIEYRNLCVRKVELLLVRNYADNTRDEFNVRISAHAQRITMRSGYVVNREEYVTPFEEYLTFGRLDGQWKLKEIVPPAKGTRLIGQENVDEESSREQLEWYYQQTRAVS